MIDLEQVSCSFYGDDTQVINKAIYLYHGVTLSAVFFSLRRTRPIMIGLTRKLMRPLRGRTTFALVPRDP